MTSASENPDPAQEIERLKGVPLKRLMKPQQSDGQVSTQELAMGTASRSLRPLQQMGEAPLPPSLEQKARHALSSLQNIPSIPVTDEERETLEIGLTAVEILLESFPNYRLGKEQQSVFNALV